MIEAVYQRSCPSCGGDVERKRLLAGLPCSKCSEPRGLLAWKEELEEAYEEFAEFFKKTYGFELWGPQRAWAKLALSGFDAVLLAPTGTGKSTFLAALSSFLKKKRKKVLYVVPSKSLEAQVRERLTEEVDVITARKLVRDPRAYRGYDVYVFDDVDSVMKSPKSATALIIALGLEEAVSIVNEMVDMIKRGLVEGDGGKRYEELKARLEELKEEKGPQVIMASATAGGGSLTAKLMLSLLGLSPASAPPAIRYVDDVKLFYEDPVEGVVETVRRFVSKGFKGIVFVHEGFPIEEVEKALREKGVAAEVTKSGRLKPLKKLEKGELDVIVAYSSRYGVVARGIDMPDVIRFAVFLRPPFKKFDLEKGLNNPLTLLRVMKKLEMKEESVKLFKALSKLSDVELALLRRAMEEDGDVGGFLGNVLSLLKETKIKVLELLKERKVVDNGIVIKNGKIYLLDSKTYLQASGRTSRLTPKGMTHGVSVVVYDDEDLMNAFEKDLKDRVEFKEELVMPKGPKPVKAKNVLIVVESPTKAKTFAKVMGGGGRIEVGGVPAHLAVHELEGEALFAFIVATKGHLFDITLDDVGTYGVELGDPIRVYYAPVNRCRRCNLAWASSDPKCPKCGLPAESSTKVVDVLRKLAAVVDEVYLATDPDEEGEKIAWDVMAMIFPFNTNIKRVKYYEVTLRGLREALSSPTGVDEGVVRSQIVRRLDDRLVGFAVSERLKATFGDPNHGLGRVQGPVLKFVVERARARKAATGYSVKLILSNGDSIRLFVKTKEEAFKLASVERVKVLKVEESVEELKPLPPYTTDTMLEDASKLGLDPSKTMRIAQDLFEMGFITYHRTDSTRVSDAGMAVAREWITSKFEGLFVPRRWGEGGAHEAIRPTKPLSAEELKLDFALNGMGFEAIRLYDMIFRRFMASQMKEAKVKKVKVVYEVAGMTVESWWVAEVLEPGWTAVWSVKTKSVKLEKEVKVVSSEVRRSSLVQLPKVFEVIRWMKERGVGRPSTYAKTVENLRRHGYIVITPNNYVVSTKKGVSVVEYVERAFPELAEAEYTRKLEEAMELARTNFWEAVSGTLRTFRALASLES